MNIERKPKINIDSETGLPRDIFHLKLLYKPNQIRKVVEKIGIYKWKEKFKASNLLGAGFNEEDLFTIGYNQNDIEKAREALSSEI